MKLHMVALLLGLVLCIGCKTNTRLGYLIPGNPNSQSEKNEVVRLDFIPHLEGNRVMPGLPASLAVSAVELGIELVKTEFEKEAESYEAQFSKSVVLTTTEIEKGGYIVLTRWVDNRNLHLNDRFEMGDTYCKITNGFFNQVKFQPPSSFPYRRNFDEAAVLAKKNLAFMFVAEVSPLVGPLDNRKQLLF